MTTDRVAPIVVRVDGSPQSLRGLDRAVQEAMAHRSTARTETCAPPP